MSEVIFALSDGEELELLRHVMKILRGQDIEKAPTNALRHRYQVKLRQQHPKVPFPFWARVRSVIGDPFTLDFFTERLKHDLLDQWVGFFCVYYSLDLRAPNSLSHKTLRTALKMAMSTPDPVTINGSKPYRTTTIKPHGCI
jgi:hypothetical protein